MTRKYRFLEHRSAVQYSNRHQKLMEFSGFFNPIYHFSHHFSLLLVLVQLVFVLVLSTTPVRCGGAYDNYTRDDFPPDFVFGAGTSAYQYEGAAAEDGRTPSVWDTLAHQGKIPDGSTGDIASDGYHKYKEDVKLMSDIGLEAYRFSISWSRIIPNGRGAVNPKGLKYYNDVIDELIKHGIQPHVTICQLDIPQVLEDEYGGWLSAKIVDDFRAYSDVCFREFGDRVLHWTTLDEPNIQSIGGYDNGAFAPARCSKPFGVNNCSAGNSTTEPYITLHNQMLAHAAAFELYKTKYKATQKGFIGFNLYTFWYAPYTESAADVEATQRAIDFMIGWLLEPLAYGDYPKIMKDVVGSRLPSFTSKQSELVKGAYDFLSINHYFTVFVKDAVRPQGLRDYNGDVGVAMTASKNETPSGSYIPESTPPDPAGLEKILGYLKREYNNPAIYIQENGFATPGTSSTLEDPGRIDFIKSYVGALLSAIRNGSNSKGYFVWAFMDVFEFLFGYQQRYGMYYVDFDDINLRRMPRKSALWYKSFLNRTGDMKIASATLNGALQEAK